MSSNVILLVVLTAFILFYSASAPVIRHKNIQLLYAVASLAIILLSGYVIFDLSRNDFGFTEFISGTAVGIVVSLLLGMLITVSSRISLTRGFFKDARVAGDTVQNAARKTLVDIPFATVAIEELLFRGLLLGWLLTIQSTTSAVLISSLLFGAWHVLPAVAFAKARGATRNSIIGSILGTVAFTSIAGGFFAWLRIESGSIVAPIIVHYVVNTTSYFASWSVNNLDMKQAN